MTRLAPEVKAARAPERQARAEAERDERIERLVALPPPPTEEQLETLRRVRRRVHLPGDAWPPDARMAGSGGQEIATTVDPMALDSTSKTVAAATVDDFVTIKVAAKRLQCSEKTVRNWIAQGKLTGYRMGPKMIRLLAVDVNTYARAKQVPTL